MYCKEALVFYFLFIIQIAITFPIGLQTPMNNVNSFNQKILPESVASATPVITEIVPSLQFGEITVAGDLPVGGSIRVKGCFPVYGTVAVDGGLPSAGTAIVNTGGGVLAQIV
ncbi:unnamed protein product [Arctia plantaginis]|uniref:Uncharacterized protein n=1 Tax=Arctia plantaginis TaxID=874455 RepID=A0A8S1A3V9_ARCPL|nr:unnamed protein product [Arctia plantaginis]CAB3261916.1 unnamed protein product [Arctia plantaginis]